MCIEAVTAQNVAEKSIFLQLVCNGVSVSAKNSYSFWRYKRCRFWRPVSNTYTNETASE